MKVLLIKTSSMGDLIHTLPALTDAETAIPGITFDWVVEDTFVDIPRWHPAVRNVIPVSLRTWRKRMFSKATLMGLQGLRQRLKDQHYDIILDAQGLMKSAFIGFFAQGKRVGLDFKSARESFASLCYQKKCKVNFYQHAVVRMRLLFSKALDYQYAGTAPCFGLQKNHSKPATETPYLVFLHGTTWATKQWPENYWVGLAQLAKKQGYSVKISGGNEEEVARASRITEQCDNIELLPYLSIAAMADLLAGAKGVVAVDTGFGHLAAALDIPTVSLYGPTDVNYTGALGESSIQLAADFKCAPCLQRHCTYRGASAVLPACFEAMNPERVWLTLQQLLADYHPSLVSRV